MKGTSTLSTRQRRILAVIRDFTAEYGYPPTIRQIGEAVGISSTSVVSYNLTVLQRKGYLTRDRDVSRGLRLVEDQEGDDLAERTEVTAVAVPLLGAIAAGEPIPIPDGDFAQIDADTLNLPTDLVPDTEGVYALEVRGTSMIDALINDGDIVIMRHQETAENGDMVAAWLKDEKATTLKRVYWERERSLVRLQPANPLMDSIYVHPDDLEIQGKVIGVIRRL
ncbi:MAG TPA: transcriptional repressor LexA [Chloroflexi bacterium]|jgi:repressor LexA|nr:transcriptional repressor LexA [Chloroflexota bacterium]